MVVLNEGDLTSEEALKDKLAKEQGSKAVKSFRILFTKIIYDFIIFQLLSIDYFIHINCFFLEENSKPADLTKRVIFKRPAKSTPQSEEKHRVNKKKKRTGKLVLSFDDDEECS